MPAASRKIKLSGRLCVSGLRGVAGNRNLNGPYHGCVWNPKGVCTEC